MATLSEAQSKDQLAPLGLRFPLERVVSSANDAASAASAIGFPVVVKLCGDAIAHKTERGLVRIGLNSAADVANAATELFALARPEDGEVGVLVAEFIRGTREFIAGVVRDPTFGACVMLGVGGIFAEALEDVAFRVAPLTETDAHDLIDDLTNQKLLGPFRGEPAVDRNALANVLLGLSAFVMARPDVVSVDCNPMIIRNGEPIVADALVELNAMVSA